MEQFASDSDLSKRLNIIAPVLGADLDMTAVPQLLRMRRNVAVHCRHVTADDIKVAGKTQLNAWQRKRPLRAGFLLDPLAPEFTPGHPWSGRCKEASTNGGGKLPHPPQRDEAVDVVRPMASECACNDELDAAAARIQAVYRGSVARKDTQKIREARAEDERAAIAALEEKAANDAAAARVAELQAAALQMQADLDHDAKQRAIRLLYSGHRKLMRHPAATTTQTFDADVHEAKETKPDLKPAATFVRAAPCFKCGIAGHGAKDCQCTCGYRCKWLGRPCPHPSCGRWSSSWTPHLEPQRR